MNPQSRKKRMELVLQILKKTYPDAKCSLDYKTPFQLLCATILSAQCTDERVNKVTPALFKKYPDAKSMARADLADIEKLVQSTGFYKNKAKGLIGCAQKVMDLHGGKVPQTVSELTLMPGVGRKTANVVLGNVYGIPSLVVDTHVGRLCRRMGFTKNKNPELVEQDMMRIVPEKDWVIFSHLLIAHGRARCDARNPDCTNCELSGDCPRVGVVEKSSKLSKAVLAVFVCLVAAGCSTVHKVVSDVVDPLDQPSRVFDDEKFYKDVALPFKPDHIWRLNVRWILDRTSEKHAILEKTFSFIPHNDKAKKWWGKLKSNFSTDDDFRSWFFSNLAPLRGDEFIRENQITEGSNIVYQYQFKNRVPLANQKYMRPDAVWFPEKILDAIGNYCFSSEDDLMDKEDGFGIEVKLQSREQNPGAIPWEYKEIKKTNYILKTWSFAEGNRIVYRMWFTLLGPVATCPVPSGLKEDLWAVMERLAKETGILW